MVRFIQSLALAALTIPSAFARLGVQNDVLGEDESFFARSLQMSMSMPATPDIPGTAIAAGGFDTLVAALSATDLVGALSAPNGPFTVFAPTDDAFAALPEGLVGCLLDNTDVLATILLYHVASGKVLSTDLSDGQEIATLQGDAVVVDLSDGVKINDSNVIAADVIASNGVIHVIDAGKSKLSQTLLFFHLCVESRQLTDFLLRWPSSRATWSRRRWLLGVLHRSS